MHTISPYLLRCYDQTLSKKKDERYHYLSSIKGSKDLLDIVNDFMTSHEDKYNLIESDNIVYKFSCIQRVGRGIFCWFEVGTYGIKTDIINIETQEVDFQKAQNNSEIIKHYIYFDLPIDNRNGFLFLHAYRNSGIKTILHKLFKPYFTSNAFGLNLQMNPVNDIQAAKKWYEAQVKEVRLVKYNAKQKSSDLADKVSNYHTPLDIEVTLRPPRKKIWAKLGEMLDRSDEPTNELIALAEDSSRACSHLALHQIYKHAR